MIGSTANRFRQHECQRAGLAIPSATGPGMKGVKSVKPRLQKGRSSYRTLLRSSVTVDTGKLMPFGAFFYESSGDCGCRTRRHRPIVLSRSAAFSARTAAHDRPRRNCSAANAQTPALTKVRHVFVKAGSRVNNEPKTVPSSRVSASTVCTASATPTELRRVSSYANNNREGADTLRDAVQGLSRWFDRRNRRIAKSRINAHQCACARR
jgi:hypothetical protein